MRMGREEQRAGWSPEPQSLAAQTPSISRCKKKNLDEIPGSCSNLTSGQLHIH